jgi:uncharacterized membrane protein
VIRGREPRDAGERDLERVVGRLIVAVTYVAVGLLLVGVLFMVVSGISPLAGGPPFDPDSLPGDLARLEPGAFLWLGLLTVIATPISRVIAAAVGYARIGDRFLVAVALAILAVIGASVATGMAAG